MKKKKLIISAVIIVFVVIIVLIVIWVKFVPTQKISFLAEQNKDSIISKTLCNYPVKVSGDSMSPLFENGETINFNKCFKAEGLQKDDVVVFDSGNIMKIGVVREIVPGESGRYYKISQEARKDDISDVFPEKIIAIYNQ